MKLTPMLASWAASVPEVDEGEWIYEPKWDGLRALVRIDDDLKVRVLSRRGQALSRPLPELSAMGAAIGRPVVLDGEIVALDGDGRPSYERLAARLYASRPERVARATPVTFVAFDVLQLDGEPLMDQPWWLRRDVLTGLAWPGGAAVATMASDDGDALASATARLGLEGVMCKRRRARYVCGRRTGAWIKVKHPHAGWFDLVGWRPESKSHPQGALVLADDDRPAGTATMALSPEQRFVLAQFVERHGTQYGPLIRVPHGAQVRVHYGERSPRGLVRDAIAHEIRPALPGSA
jgi:bifunctional non-homologous end joining protein LigD